MAQELISLIKFRRGDSQSLKKAVDNFTIFEEGEPIYVTDTQRMMIGNGAATNNVTVVGNKFFDVEPPVAYTGDLCYTDGFLNYYKNNDWHKVLPAVDGTSIKFNSEDKLEAVVSKAGNGINIIDGTIGVNINDNFTFSNSKLSIALGGITRENITLSDVFDGNYFSFQTGEKVKIKHDNSLTYNLGGLSINNIPDNVFANLVNTKFSSTDFSYSNNTLSINNDIKTVNANNNIIGAKMGIIGYGAATAQMPVTGSDSEYKKIFYGSADKILSDTWDDSNLSYKVSGLRNKMRIHNGINTSQTGALTRTNSIEIKSAGFISVGPGEDLIGRKRRALALPCFEMPDIPGIGTIISMDFSDRTTAPILIGKNIQGIYWRDINENKYKISQTNEDITATFYGYTSENNFPDILEAMENKEWGIARLEIPSFSSFDIDLYKNNTYYTLSGKANLDKSENKLIFATYTSTQSETILNKYNWHYNLYFANYTEVTSQNTLIYFGAIPGIIQCNEGIKTYKGLTQLTFDIQNQDSQKPDIDNNTLRAITGENISFIENDDIYFYE